MLDAPQPSIELRCSTWQPIASSGDGWSAVGDVVVRQTSDARVAVSLEELVVLRDGIVANGDFIGMLLFLLLNNS
jgi:hypothetical protein